MSLRRAYFCIRSIEGQTKLNDSILNLIAAYLDMGKHL